MMEPDHDRADPESGPTKELPGNATEPAASEASDPTKEEEETTPKSVEPSLAKIFGMAKPEMGMLLVAVVLMVGAEAVNLVVPLILAKAYDALVNFELTEEERMSEINDRMVIVVVVFLVAMVAGWLRGAILAVIGERMVARLRNVLYASILSQEIAFFDEHKSGELVSRLGSDTTLLQTVISQSLPEACLGLAKTIVAIVLMFYISATLAGVSLGGVVVVLAFCLPMGKVLARLSKEYQDLLGEAQTYSTEVFGAMRTVQSFAAEEKELERFGQKIGDPSRAPLWWPLKEPSTYRVGVFKSLTSASFFTVIFGGGFGFLYVSLWYGFFLVNSGEITFGELTAFQTYVFTIGAGLGAAAGHLANVMNGLGASGRIFYLIERVPSIPTPEPPTDENDDNNDNKDNHKDVETPPKEVVPRQPASPAIQPDSMEGNLEFHDISFSYPTRPGVPVLNNFSVNMGANTTTALVGSSGSGKSTVVALLQRFYDIDSGSITVDGNDIRDLDLGWLRKHIGYVQQEPQLFGMTVRENILYGANREVTEAEIRQACTDANCHDFISSWPNGYETVVGERGVKLSGGQKQRIAIARALLTNCRILLLDEATSALDAESEHVVQEAIDKAMVGRTVIVVAHRLSTIKDADQIIVMDDHAIAGIGTHQGLFESCTKYRDLIKRQSLTVTEPPPAAFSIE